MGWFDEQIRQRKKEDADVFSESVYDIIGAVGDRETFYKGGDTKNEMDRILQYYGAKSRDIPPVIKDADAQIEYLLRPYGIMKRSIVLKDGWHKNAMYPMLAVRKDGTWTALIPRRHGGYDYADRETGRMKRVVKKTESLFEEKALCFYKPYPQGRLSQRELMGNIVRSVSLSDIMVFALISLLAVLISAMMPSVYQVLLTYVAPQGRLLPLAAAAVFLLCMVVSTHGMEIVKRLLVGRLKNHIQLTLESALMMRILSLPSAFFQKHSAGELSGKIKSAADLSRDGAEALVMSGSTALLSLVYLLWIAVCAPSLFTPSWVSAVVWILVTWMMIRAKVKLKDQGLEQSAKEQEISYSLMTAISKIKLVGAETRAFAKWGKLYAEHAKTTYHLPIILKYEKAWMKLIAILGMVWVYAAAAGCGMPAAEFYAFSAAYGMLMGMLSVFSETSDRVAGIGPSLEHIGDFFKTESEISPDKQIVTHLSGGVELNHVTFRYHEDQTVLQDLSLKIRPGEYVAIVGKTGCGKSTLIRLLLGFETPQKGAVYYDGKDLSKLDLKTLRQKIGIVLQNGKLFSGDIFSNLAIASPNLTIEEAWDAAEKAGVAEDIKNMPMGMHTLVSEGGSELSGGQRQRILIARALASAPRMMIFDEATSALDNVTQKIVSQTLDSMKCTRIIVAHRLSTIQKCSRIIVLDQGRIVEDGGYDALIQKGGWFAKLVDRQKIE